MPLASNGLPIERVEVSAYRVPTDAPESDGTLEWSSTTLVLVEVLASGRRGLGYSYASAGAATVVKEELAEVLQGGDPFAIPALHASMVERIRNIGGPGVAASAVAAADVALWDLKARLLELPLVALLGAARPEVEVYGSGGFTSYADARLQEQLSGWVAQGIRSVKMKVGREPGRDVERVRRAREAVGTAALFVDANGAYRRKQALELAARFGELGVTWFEEPVSSDDLEGLRLLRDRAPAAMEIAAGEYGYDLFYFRRMLEAEAVDVLQVDATRCLGISGFLRAALLAEARGLPVSAHTAPSIHLHACLATSAQLRPLEYFHDHARIEQMLFEGAPRPSRGALRPDLSRPGLGLELRRADARRFAL